MTYSKSSSKRTRKRGSGNKTKKSYVRAHAKKTTTSAKRTTAPVISKPKIPSKARQQKGTIVNFPNKKSTIEPQNKINYEYNPSEQERISLAKMIMKLFELWQLSTSEQLGLLGYRPSARATLKRYREGEPFGSDRDRLERVGHLLAIHASLRTIFKFNPELAYGWIKAENKRFDKKTPIEYILKEGFIGLVQVRTYLDVERYL